MDYTPEGVKYNQREIAISHLYFINKELKKLNRTISTICVAGIIFVTAKHKDKIVEFIKMKGE